MYILSSVCGDSLDTTSFLPALDIKGREEGLFTQCLTYGSVLGRRHLDTAFINAVKNFAYGENFARTFTLEILLMLSGQRQIKDALDHFGLSTGSKRFLIFLSPRAGVEGLIRDYSMENIITYRKNFELRYKESLIAGGRRLIRGLGLNEEWIISGTGPQKSPEIVSDEPLRDELLAMSGIQISEKIKTDPIDIEKMVCEKINLIQCK